MGLGEGMEYSGDGSGSGGGEYGNHRVNPHQPRLRFDREDVLMDSGPTETVAFRFAHSEYKARYFVRDVLTRDAETQKNRVTSPRSEQKIFREDGRLEMRRDAYGNEAHYSYVDEKLASVVTGTGTESVGYFYIFDSSDRLESVTLRVGGTTSASDYRRTTCFYTASGDLEKTVLDEFTGGAWEEIETSYCRYHTTGDRKLRFVLNDHAYEQMHSVNPSWPESATDAEVAQYADAEYASYDGDGRVTETKTKGGKYPYQAVEKR